MKGILQSTLPLLLIVFSTQADFKNTIAYAVTVPKFSEWGVSDAKGISNNSGKAGVIVGKDVGLICTPSASYGVNQWSETTSKTYACAKGSKVNAVTATSCPTQEKITGKAVGYDQYFKNIEKDLHTDVEKTLETLVASFPDYSKGEGYLSEAYLSFSSSLGVQNVSEPSNQLVDVSAQQTQMLSAISGVDDLSTYFIDEEFVIALDFRTLLGSKVSSK
jgi:hypothetical protein